MTNSVKTSSFVAALIGFDVVPFSSKYLSDKQLFQMIQFLIQLIAFQTKKLVSFNISALVLDQTHREILIYVEILEHL
jgi:hypothetical protein